jgi:hypothetical protein
MLTEAQDTKAWERQIESEVRSLYFADLTHVYSARKQAITFLTFFLSSSAAATLLGKAPIWVAIVCSSLVAVVTAYSVAVGLDAKIATVSKLHGDWALLAIEYENLRENASAPDAAKVLAALLRRELEASKLGASDAPNESERMDRWTDLVFQNHGFSNG